jgi:hypothetical protein
MSETQTPVVVYKSKQEATDSAKNAGYLIYEYEGKITATRPEERITGPGWDLVKEGKGWIWQRLL